MLICIGKLLFMVIHSYTKCQCIETKLETSLLLLLCFVFLSTRVQLDYYFDWFENTMGSWYYAWHFPRKRDASKYKFPHELQPSWTSSKKPSYMVIKKALYGRQPGCFYLWFYLSPFAATRELVCSFVSGIFNKVPSLTYFGLKKLLFAFGNFIPARVCARYDF